MALDPQTGQEWLGGKTGGVSGPAIRAIALQQVAAVADSVKIPVIGMGGIASGRHAQDFLTAGASAIAVGTESFRDPAAGRRIADELTELSLSGASRAPASTLGRARLGDTEPEFPRRMREVSGRRP
jgi:dihydroorotate dehydrogenase (NAD+) catalytic subunit